MERCELPDQTPTVFTQDWQLTIPLNSNLVRLSHGEITAIGAGHGTTDQEQVIRQVDPDHLEVPHRDLVMAEMPRLADALEGPRRIGAGARGAGMPVHPLDPVRGPQAAEAMPLDDPGIAPPLACAGHVHPSDLLEEVDGQLLPFRDLGGPILANFPDIAFGLGVDLACMTAFGLGGPLPALVVESELPGVVTVAVLGPDLEHGAGAAFQDGDRHDGPILLVDL